jgi:hypothetical protein
MNGLAKFKVFLRKYWTWYSLCSQSLAHRIACTYNFILRDRVLLILFFILRLSKKIHLGNFRNIKIREIRLNTIIQPVYLHSYSSSLYILSSRNIFQDLSMCVVISLMPFELVKLCTTGRNLILILEASS